MKKIILFLLTFFLLIEPNARIYSASIPESLKPLYNYLNDVLSINHQWVDQHWDGTINPDYLPNTSLIIANSNAANPGYLTSSYLNLVESYIKSLKNLGCKSIQIDLQFPLFDDNFFSYAKNNKLLPVNGPGASDYLNFYKNVAKIIRNQGLVFTIESQVVFTQKTFSQLPVKGYYQYFNDQGELGLELYKIYRLDMLKVIVTELSPDYLTICDEPDTEVWLTGINLLKNKDNYAGMVSYFIHGLQPLAQKTKLGCGFGIWDANSDYWINKWSTLPIQFMNIHLYGLDNFSQNYEGNMIPKLIKAIDKIQAKKLSVVIGECWLYKVMKNDTKDIERIYGRDLFDTFIPLDISYLKLVVKIAQWKKLAYESPFWSSFFFSYLTFDEAKNLSSADRMKLNNSKMKENMQKGIVSPTGKAYQEMNLHPSTLKSNKQMRSITKWFITRFSASTKRDTVSNLVGKSEG
jgi:hypothetical protein